MNDQHIVSDLNLIKTLRCIEQNIGEKYEVCDKCSPDCKNCPFFIDEMELDFSTNVELASGLAASRLEALLGISPGKKELTIYEH